MSLVFLILSWQSDLAAVSGTSCASLNHSWCRGSCTEFSLIMQETSEDNVPRAASPDWTIEVCVLMVYRSIKGKRVETWNFFSWTEHQSQQCGATPFPVSQPNIWLCLGFADFFCKHGVQNSVCFGEAMWSMARAWCAWCAWCACMSGMSLTGMSLNLQSTNDTNGNCCTEPHLAPGLEECRSKLQKKHSCKGSDKTCWRNRVDTADERKVYSPWQHSEQREHPNQGDWHHLESVL